MSPLWWSPSDLLQVVEGLPAVQATVQRLARGCPELRGQLGGGGAALRAVQQPARRDEREGDGAGRADGHMSGWGDAVLAQLAQTFGRDPVRAPSGLQHSTNVDYVVSRCCQTHPEVIAHCRHGWAPRVRRGDE